MNKKAILARLKALKAEAQTILDTADAAAGVLSAEQRDSFDGTMAEIAAAEQDLKRIETLEDLALPRERAVEPSRPAEAVVSNPRPAIESDPMRGFRSAAEFGYVVRAASAGRVDDRLRALSLEGGTMAAPSSYHAEKDSSEGYLVPPQMAAEISKLVMGDEGLLARLNPEPTQSNHVELLVDEDTPWGTTGIKAYWDGEASQHTTTKSNLKKDIVTLHKLVALVQASDELLADAPRLQNRLTVNAADAIRYAAEEAVVNGNGVGKPLGWFGRLISVSKKTSQTADTVVAENVASMWSRLLNVAPGAFWLCHPLVKSQLPLMTVGQQPVFVPPSQGFAQAPAGLLYGLPVVISQQAQVLGDAGDIQLVDPNGYASFVKSGGIDFAMSMHLYFDYSVSAFRWTFRLGGAPRYSGNVTAKDGSTTLGHFITVEART